MTNLFYKTGLIGGCLGFILFAISNIAIAEEPKAEALKILSRTAKFMEDKEQFSVTATIWEDEVTEQKVKLQSTRFVEVKRRFPGKFRADTYTNQLDMTFAYDGKVMTVVQHADRAFGEFTAPNTLRETLDKIEKKRDITIPLEDILYKGALYKAAKSAISGEYVIKSNVLGKVAHHLAFQHKNIDWQVWVQAGPVPVILKVVITFKNEDLSPQTMVLLDNWDLSTELPDYVFDVYLTSDYKQYNVRTLETNE